MAKSTPLQFDIPSMHCDGCVAAVTKAAKRVDAGAEVVVDLATKRVVIGSTHEAYEFIQAIDDAGFEVKAAG